MDILGSLSCCSLALNHIGPILDSMDLSKPLEKLKCLSLSLSHGTAGDSSDNELKSHRVVVKWLVVWTELQESLLSGREQYIDKTMQYFYLLGNKLFNLKFCRNIHLHLYE